MTVLVLGANGGIGRLTVRQLLERGEKVSAVVRSKRRIPTELADHPNLTIVETNFLHLSLEQISEHLDGKDTVIICLGHNLTFKGLFLTGMIVRDTTRLVCEAIIKFSKTPKRVIEVNTVGTNNTDGTDLAKRGFGERRFIGALKVLLPPFKDSQRSLDYFGKQIGNDHPLVQWCVVRPDTLKNEPVSEYKTSATIMTSIFKAQNTARANVAHFMCDLALNPDVWSQWKFKMPVVVNVT